MVEENDPPLVPPKRGGGGIKPADNLRIGDRMERGGVV